MFGDPVATTGSKSYTEERCRGTRVPQAESVVQAQRIVWVDAVHELRLSVERGLEILDPLPADNVAQLIGFLVEMGQRGDDEEDNGEEEIAE